MFLQPDEIFVRPGRVYDEQKFFVFDPINDQIVYYSTAFVEEKSVLACPVLELVHIVSQHRIKPCAGTASLDNQLAHVRNIENADAVSDGLMFLDDARVLHRHEPAAERNDFRPEPHMLFVKRRFFRHGVSHGNILVVGV